MLTMATFLLVAGKFINIFKIFGCKRSENVDKMFLNCFLDSFIDIIASETTLKYLQNVFNNNKSF